MDDNRFDDFLADVVSDESVAVKVPAVNPWKTCIQLISIGLLMMMFTLNYLGLNYILPAIGSIMIYCGVRVLKNENKLFHSSWVLSLIHVSYTLFILVAYATPLVERLGLYLTVLSSVWLTALLFSLHFGFMEVFKKAEISHKHTPFLFAALWELVMFVMVLIGVGDLPFYIAIPFIVIIILIIRSMYKLKEILPKVGYDFLLSEPRVSNKTTMIVYCTACAVLTFSMIFVFNHTVGEAVDLKIDNTLEQRQTLIDMGFPKDILSDVTDEDIKLMSDCKSILVSGENYEPEYMYEQESGEWMSDEELGIDNDLDDTVSEDPVTFCRVYLQTDATIIVLQYFNFVDEHPRKDVRFYNWFGTGSTYLINTLSGKLIYDKNGKTMVSEMIDYMNLHYNGKPIRVGEQELTGLICYPFGADKERGYIIYEFDKTEEEFFMSCFNYYLEPFRINYPYSSQTRDQGLTATGHIMQHYDYVNGYDWSDNKVYVSYDSIE
ncbi:MAG: hypothetical protein NC122_09450 [Faecalibacterium sp.]|nr:hypothetical protein [Ruminococcus sp.]MCM1392419.1 hypothetical protein [Ruminococcus sp.]MCM1486416.1 hypothetical protein [Faecalibacterium sp.]